MALCGLVGGESGWDGHAIVWVQKFRRVLQASLWRMTFQQMLFPFAKMAAIPMVHGAVRAIRIGYWSGDWVGTACAEEFAAHVYELNYGRRIPLAFRDIGFGYRYAAYGKRLFVLKRRY